MSKNAQEIKMILLGESGVGKTSIIKRYLNDQFDAGEVSTLSMSYVSKTLSINNKKITLNIWDTIGQEKYRSISKLFLNETKIVILVYSIISQQSFSDLNYWYNLYKEILGEETILGVAGNKVDLFLDQEVSEDNGRDFAEKRGAIFAQLSAKENKNSIDSFLDKLVKAYLEKNDVKFGNSNNNEEKNTIKLDENNVRNDNEGCCKGGKKKNKKKKNENDIKDDKYVNSIFLGENGVGKTSLIRRIKGKEFNKKEVHTNKINETKIEYKNKEINLKIFDIDNNKKDSKETTDIINNCKLFFLVYDIKNKESLDNLNDWINNIKKNKGDNNNYLIIILANKKDKSSEDKAGEGIAINEDNKGYIDEGKKLADDNNGIFRTTSALDNVGLDNIIGESLEKYLSHS